MADLSTMARISRRAGATLARRADETWDPADLVDTLAADTTALVALLREGADPAALAPSMADLLWSLLVLADDNGVELATAYDQRITEVLGEIRRKLVTLDAGEQLR